MNSNSRLTIGQVVGVGAAVVVLFLFFFPWVEINLLLVTTNLSGFQLATGSAPGGGFPGIPSLLLIPLSMLGVLAVGVLCFLIPGSQLKTVAAVLLIAAGGISALILILQYLSVNQELNKDVLGMFTQNMFTYGVGAHGSLVGSALVAGGGLLDLVTGKKPA
jgi:hypothetical protein